MSTDDHDRPDADDGAEPSEHHDHPHHHEPPIDPSRYEGLEGWKVEETSQAGRELIASLPWERFLQARDRAARAVAKKVHVKGFRKGKAPVARILALHGDEVRRQAEEDLVQATWEEAREAGGLRPVGNPGLVDLVVEDGQPVRFTARFEVLPQLDLQGIEDVAVDDKVVKVSGEDVEQEIQRLREARAEIVDSDKDEAGPGDLALVSLHRFAPGADPASSEPEETREDVLIEVGSEKNPPELDKALLGLGLGEMRAFSSPGREEGSGVPGRVLLKGVKERRLPEVDDEFAQSLDAGFDGVEALRNDLRERLVAARKGRAAGEQDEQVVEHLVTRNPVEMPRALVEHEAEARIRRGMQGLAMQGVDLEKANIDWAAEFERARRSAEQALRADYLLELAGDALEVEVAEEDVVRGLDEESRRRGVSAKQLRAELVKSNKMNEFRQSIRRRLTLDKLKAGATVSVE